MSLIAPKIEKSFDLVPAGTHVARVISIIHLGTRHGEWQGEPKAYNEVRITFELCNEKKVFDEAKGEQPFIISRAYTLSFGEKSRLLPIVKGVIGSVPPENFDLYELLGKACLLQVIHEPAKNDPNKIYASIVGTSPLAKGMTAPEPENPLTKLGYGDDWNVKVFDALPDFLKEKMQQTDEYKAMFERVEDLETFEAHSPF